VGPLLGSPFDDRLYVPINWPQIHQEGALISPRRRRFRRRPRGTGADRHRPRLCCDLPRGCDHRGRSRRRAREEVSRREPPRGRESGVRCNSAPPRRRAGRPGGPTSTTSACTELC